MVSANGGFVLTKDGKVMKVGEKVEKKEKGSESQIS